MNRKILSYRNKHNKLKIALIIVISFILVFSVVSMIIVKITYDGFFPRAEVQKYSSSYKYSDKEGYNRSVVSFYSGSNKLTGYIYGEENNSGLVIISHGLGGGAESYLEQTIYFVEQGWCVFTYDCTGSFDSEGSGTIGLAQSVLDLDAALTYIESNNSLNKLPKMLFGHSWGGYAVTAVLNKEHDITAVASVAGFNSPMEMMVEWTEGMMGVLTYVMYPFLWSYQVMLFGETVSLTGVDGINKADIPVMIIHGNADSVVLYDGAGIISHKNDITNSKVVYKTCDEEYSDGHNNLFWSAQATQYANEINEKYSKLDDEHGGDMTDDILEGFYSEVDKARINELNSGLMDEINMFFQSNS